MQTEPPKADPPKRKRRWFQFSLRTLMIVVVIVAIPCAWLGRKIERKRQEREAVAAIKKMGGLVGYDYQMAGAKPPGPDWLRNVLGENIFSEVASVSYYFGKANVTDTEAVQLRELAALQKLDLSDTSLTDAGLANLKGLIHLDTLDLSRTNVTDAGLKYLSGLNQLEALVLIRTDVSDAGLEGVKELTKLRQLYLPETNVSDAGLENLKELTHLRYLDLRKTNVTDIGATELHKSLPNCRIEH